MNLALRARYATKLSQPDFADQFCLDRQLVREWESGEREPDNDGSCMLLHLIEMFPGQMVKHVELWKINHDRFD